MFEPPQHMSLGWPLGFSKSPGPPWERVLFLGRPHTVCMSTRSRSRITTSEWGRRGSPLFREHRCSWSWGLAELMGHCRGRIVRAPGG